MSYPKFFHGRLKPRKSGSRTASPTLTSMGCHGEPGGHSGGGGGLGGGGGGGGGESSCEICSTQKAQPWQPQFKQWFSQYSSLQNGWQRAGFFTLHQSMSGHDGILPVLTQSDRTSPPTTTVAERSPMGR